jgi:aspartate/methionine/tyrosine aminotransferase
MTKQVFAKRVEKLSFSSSLASMRRIRELRQAGVKIHDFGSKFDTPDHIKQAAIEYLSSPTASLYADSRGIPPLRQAVARQLARDNGWVVDPDTEVTVTPGGKMGILAALLALVDAGDEVLVEDPGWLSFEPMVRISGAKPVPLPLQERDGYRFSIADLRKRINRKTRVLVLCNPHNPTGRVFDRADLEAIAQVVIEHGLVVIMDEAYDHFVFDGLKHISMACIDGMRERTVTVYTASKTYNMFGWRVGWVVASPSITEKIQLISAHSFTCVTSFVQAGAASALDGTLAQGHLSSAELSRNYQAQRQVLVDGLRAIPGVTCTLPRGAYFVFPNFKRLKISSQELATRLFENARVSGLAGSVFGKRGEGHIRFVFNAPVAEISEGVERLQNYLRKL